MLPKSASLIPRKFSNNSLIFSSANVRASSTSSTFAGPFALNRNVCLPDPYPCFLPPVPPLRGPMFAKINDSFNYNSIQDNCHIHIILRPNNFFLRWIIYNLLYVWYYNVCGHQCVLLFSSSQWKNPLFTFFCPWSCTLGFI